MSLVQSGYILLDLLHLVLSHKYPKNPKYILTFGSSHQISSYLQACFSKKGKWGGNSKNSHSSKATVWLIFINDYFFRELQWILLTHNRKA